MCVRSSYIVHSRAGHVTDIGTEDYGQGDLPGGCWGLEVIDVQ